MELYHNNMSVCAQKVRLVLCEKGLHPVEHHLNLRAGDATKPEYLKLNPNGVVPTLVDQGTSIIESTVICEYLEEAYPDPPLRPEAPLARAAMRLWTRRPDGGLHDACGITSVSIYFRQQMLAFAPEEIERLIEEKPDPKIREVFRTIMKLGVAAPMVAPALKAYDSTIELVARQLDRTPWLAGTTYTLADAALLPYVCRLEHLAMDWMWSGARASVADWLARCKARPNFSGIADYLDQKYLDLMRDSGLKVREQVESILKT